MISNKNLKGLVHGALALGALTEAMTTKSRFRQLLSGAAAGYHLHATLYHLMWEKDDAIPTWKEVVHGCYDAEEDDEEFWET